MWTEELSSFEDCAADEACGCGWLHGALMSPVNVVEHCCVVLVVVVVVVVRVVADVRGRQHTLCKPGEALSGV